MEDVGRTMFVMRDAQRSILLARTSCTESAAGTSQECGQAQLYETELYESEQCCSAKPIAQGQDATYIPNVDFHHIRCAEGKPRRMRLGHYWALLTPWWSLSPSNSPLQKPKAAFEERTLPILLFCHLMGVVKLKKMAWNAESVHDRHVTSDDCFVPKLLCAMKPLSHSSPLLRPTGRKP